MIVKRTFDPRKVSHYVWREVAAGTGLAIAVYLGFEFGGAEGLALPQTIIGVLGVALAIFLAFRNSSSYARWSEGRAMWGGVLTYSRIFARLVVTFVDAHRHTEQYDPEAAAPFQREMVYRQIAFAHALRLHLRGQQGWSELRALLPDGDYDELLARQNKPSYLVQRQGARIYDAMATGTLQGFDSFQLEGCLAQLSSFQAGCERLKTTPLLRQYGYFTTVFLYTFILFVPLSLIGALDAVGVAWAVIPVSLVIAFVFTSVAKVGEVNEDPFENQIQDVPMSAICRTIERDLREQLGETQLPPRLEPVDGYLF